MGPLNFGHVLVCVKCSNFMVLTTKHTWNLGLFPSSNWARFIAENQLSLAFLLAARQRKLRLQRPVPRLRPRVMWNNGFGEKLFGELGFSLKFTETCPAIDGAFFLSVTHSALDIWRNGKDICSRFPCLPPRRWPWVWRHRPLARPTQRTQQRGGAPARSSDMDSQKAAYFWQPSYFEVQKNGSIFKQGWNIH